MDLAAIKSMDAHQLAKVADAMRDRLVEQADYEGAMKARDLLVWLRDVRAVAESLEEQWSMPPTTE